MGDLNWKSFIMPIIILFVFIGGIIGIVNWQKSKKETAISAITVNLPEGETQATEKEIVVSGKASKGDKVYVNEEEATVEKDGSYSKTLTLNEGVNSIVVKNVKNDKETGSIERTVRYAAAPAPVSPTPSAGGQTAPAQTSPQTSGELATSGPEEIIIPVVGAGGVVFAIAFYTKSRRQLALNLRK